MTRVTENQLEQRGLWMSIYGALFMAVLGIGFAVVTSSDAVLLDGLFSLVGCAVGFVALRVATLVLQPGDDVFHFGYAAFEPMLNLTKGLLMAFITLFALVSAIIVIIDGGRDVSAGWAMVYALVAASGCFAIAIAQSNLSKRTRSPLLQVDTQNWLVDGILSVAVAVAFLIAMLLANSSFAYLMPYIDPAVVIVLVLLSLPIPAKIIRDNWNQIVGKAPDLAFQDRAIAAIQSAFPGDETVQTKMRVQQLGRLSYIQLYVLCGERADYGLKDLDECRREVANALAGALDHLALDVIFTRDPQWIAASVGYKTDSKRDHEASGEPPQATSANDAPVG
ncbi:Cation efflux family protein [Planctomycetes bacterium CA13]|uniref:Cation efflux family protein n=1 Tax=Novipirellula herctigrandis TaxID=2527986 RepID=A0A5C5Z1M0_9BACT|nr:Cation efflux family protein [Planctomycetes bacterium CA13]